MYRGNTRNRRNNRYRRLSAAGHHVDVSDPAVERRIDRRHEERTNRSRGQIDHQLAILLQSGVMFLMGIGRGRVEGDAYLRINGHLAQPFYPFMGRGNATLTSHRKPFRCRINAHHGDKLQTV